MIRITWNGITLLLLVLACSILFYVCSKSKKYEPNQQQTTNVRNLETKIQNLISQVDSLKKAMEIKEENKATIEKYYHTVLKRNEGLTAKQIDTVYSLDTMSSHEIAGHIERADYFEQLYKEQMGIDSIRQSVISTLEKRCDSEKELNNVLHNKIAGLASDVGFLASLNKDLKKNNEKLYKKITRKNNLLKTVGFSGLAAIIYAIIK